jgi:hypothetical protein
MFLFLFLSSTATVHRGGADRRSTEYQSKGPRPPPLISGYCSSGAQNRLTRILENPDTPILSDWIRSLRNITFSNSSPTIVCYTFTHTSAGSLTSIQITFHKIYFRFLPPQPHPLTLEMSLSSFDSIFNSPLLVSTK